MADAALPGTTFELGPAAGSSLAVVGVAVGHTLAVQDRPGPGATTLARLQPLDTGIVARGRARLVTSSIWVEVTARGIAGWAPARSLAAPAAPRDLTADVVRRLGRRPVAETMLDLGTLVAKSFASSEPPSAVTVTVDPKVGALGEITMDVVGLGDDSVAAQRLRVVGTPGVESFTLLRVEGTAFCSRGVGASGLCV